MTIEAANTAIADNARTQRTEWKARLNEQMRTFKKQNPWFNELSLIKGQRRTFVGDRRFMVEGRIVGLMAKAGLVETYESKWADGDKTVELTAKGARILRQQEENYEDL